MSTINTNYERQMPNFQELDQPGTIGKNFSAAPPADTPPVDAPDKVPGKDGKVNEPAPEQSTAPVNPSSISSLCSTLSPGAWIAILCVKEAAKENEDSTKALLTHNDNIQKTMQDQAKNMVKGAAIQMACTILASTASIVCSTVAGCKTLKADSGLRGMAKNQAMVAPNNWNATARFSEQVGTSVGGFINTMYQAENKKLDASVENSRTMMEGLRNHMQMQRDLSNKALDFYSSMQANMNQTHAKIFG